MSPPGAPPRRPAPARSIYLDHNATAPLLDEARAAMLRVMASSCANPSSPHRPGHAARLILEEARLDVARSIEGEPRGLVFVSGGTEADNLAIAGAAAALEPGHLLASAVEHPAVLATCDALRANGWTFERIDVGRDGRVDPDHLRGLLREDTRLVSVMAANNETGVIQPIADVAPVLRERGILLHVDAVQALGRIPIRAEAWGADFVSVSSHKIGGPAGIGALWVRDGAPLRSILHGGGQEGRRRAGTEPVLLAVGFAAAARERGAATDRGVLAGLRDRLEERLTREAGVTVHGLGAPRIGNTTSVAFEGIDAESLVIRMDLEGIAISTGSACSTGSARPSHVLRAMGVDPSIARSTVRISLGPGTTRREIDVTADLLIESAASLGAWRPVRLAREDLDA